MPHSLSLADLTAGDRARVSNVLFEGLRSIYGPHGLREGATVECLYRDGAQLTLRSPDGLPVRICRDHAQFIEVVAA